MDLKYFISIYGGWVHLFMNSDTNWIKLKHKLFTHRFNITTWFLEALQNFFKPIYIKKHSILFTAPVPAYAVKLLTFTRNTEKENNSPKFMIGFSRIWFEDCLLAAKYRFLETQGAWQTVMVSSLKTVLTASTVVHFGVRECQEEWNTPYLTMSCKI